VTDKAVLVEPDLARYCHGPTPEETRERDPEAKPHGPHAAYSIVLRVSPEAVNAFRECRPLPVGAMVVKEKYWGPAKDIY
jgi:hypothetical protein